jgi:hypothetical protein
VSRRAQPDGDSTRLGNSHVRARSAYSPKLSNITLDRSRSVQSSLLMTHRWSRKVPGIVTAVASSIASLAALAQSTVVEHPINSVREIRAGLRRCWVPPPTRAPPQLTVRLSLKRNGEILGQPLISYTSPDTSEDERAALHAAVVAAIAHCTPLPISDALGAIIAGRPINLRLGEGWRKSDWHR